MTSGKRQSLRLAMLLLILATPSATAANHYSQEIASSVQILRSIGVPEGQLCHPTTDSFQPHLPKCVEGMQGMGHERAVSDTFKTNWQTRRRQYLRRLISDDVVAPTATACEGGSSESNGGEEEVKDRWFYISNSIYAFICVCTAALAAGLTMGMLSLDPLLLLIKMRAGTTEKERNQAAKILPFVKQHHLLLVTLLLLNSLANEALPLFLEGLVSPVIAVILSVTIVLFFGEIIPSAIFTGPNKVALASQMTPLVRVVIILLYPIAFPISKMLDHFLHDDGDGDGGGDSIFNRGELSALVRIQYEERMASKKRQKEEKTRLHAEVHQKCVANDDHVGSLDFTPPVALRASIKAARRENQRRQDSVRTMATNKTGDDTRSPESLAEDAAHISHAKAMSHSIHVDEVSMVEGALQMKTKMAIDVFTPIHQVFSIPYDLILTERNMVHIYSSGYSRIPVFQPNPEKPKNRQAIRGILMSKQLIVVDKDDARPVSTLPLFVPICVSPKINLVDLLNLFQTGKVGHMALVCARPEVGREALMEDEPLPESAGLMGVITIEDVIEELLQEEIYDETDKLEREARRISKWAFRKWKKYAQGKTEEGDMGDVVTDLLEREAANEGTPLLTENQDGEDKNENGDRNSSSSGGSSGFLGMFGL